MYFLNSYLGGEEDGVGLGEWRVDGPPRVDGVERSPAKLMRLCVAKMCAAPTEFEILRAEVMTTINDKCFPTLI